MMIRQFLVVALAMMSGATATAQEWRDSLATLNRQIENNPQSTDLRLRKAAVNIELGQWESAA